MQKRYLEAGQIVATHGVGGEVRVMPWCDSPEFLAGFQTLYRSEGAEALQVERARPHKSLVILKLKGVDDVDAAIRLLRTVLYIDRSEVTLPQGSYFEQDLIGLRVVDDVTGREYGVLHEVLRTGANDVYSVRGDAGEVLVPAIHDVIKAVNIEGGEMRITPLKGLFDDAD